GEKRADNLIAAIEQGRTGRTFDRLLAGLGIPLVGSVAARVLAEKYGDLRGLLDTPPEQLRTELSAISGIGPKIADSVVNYLQNQDQRRVLEKMLELGVETVSVRRERVDGPL